MLDERKFVLKMYWKYEKAQSDRYVEYYMYFQHQIIRDWQFIEYAINSKKQGQCVLLHDLDALWV